MVGAVVVVVVVVVLDTLMLAQVGVHRAPPSYGSVGCYGLTAALSRTGTTSLGEDSPCSPVTSDTSMWVHKKTALSPHPGQLRGTVLPPELSMGSG